MPLVTSDGHRLAFPRAKNPLIPHRRTTFSLAQRFLHYSDLQRRTTALVGPGTYNAHLEKAKLLAKNCMAKYVRTRGGRRCVDEAELHVGTEVGWSLRPHRQRPYRLPLHSRADGRIVQPSLLTRLRRELTTRGSVDDSIRSRRRQHIAAANYASLCVPEERLLTPTEEYNGSHDRR